MHSACTEPDVDATPADVMEPLNLNITSYMNGATPPSLLLMSNADSKLSPKCRKAEKSSAHKQNKPKRFSCTAENCEARFSDSTQCELLA